MKGLNFPLSSVSELYPVLSELSVSRTNADAGESDDGGIPVINWPRVLITSPTHLFEGQH